MGKYKFRMQNDESSGGTARLAASNADEWAGHFQVKTGDIAWLHMLKFKSMFEVSMAFCPKLAGLLM
jgi:hypothetical protein